MNKLFPEEKLCPLEARTVAGSAKVKPYEIVLSFKVSLFIQSWRKVYLFSSYKDIKSQSMKNSLFFPLRCLPQTYIVLL